MKQEQVPSFPPIFGFAWAPTLCWWEQLCRTELLNAEAMLGITHQHVLNTWHLPVMQTAHSLLLLLLAVSTGCPALTCFAAPPATKGHAINVFCSLSELGD